MKKRGKQVLAIISISLMILIILGIVSFFINKEITGKATYSPIYTTPVVINNIPATFTWNEQVMLGTCDEVESPFGFSIYNKGAVGYKTTTNTDEVKIDFCKNVNTLVEFACGKNMPKIADAYNPSNLGPWLSNENWIYAFEIKCQYGCNNGACLTRLTQTCTDYDNGTAYYTKSSVLIKKSDGTQNWYNDQCMDSKKLRENYCNVTSWAYKDYSCPFGCNNGTCNQPTSTQCIDYDNGLNLSVYSYAIGIADITSRTGYFVYNSSGRFKKTNDEKFDTYYDWCVNDRQLNDAYCMSNGTLTYLQRDCPAGCNKGKCIQITFSCQNQGGNVCEDYQVCDGIILFAADSNRCCRGTCKLPKSFDWRNVHGENWNSPVKNQGAANTCRSFPPVGAFESQINIYYNQHLDLDLSEQMIEDCLFRDFLSNEVTCRSREGYDLNYCKTQKWGLPDEACDPYVERMTQFPTGNTCTLDYVCSDWDFRGWKNNYYVLYALHPKDITSDDIPGRIITTYPEDLKKYLIKYGPMSSGLVEWNHDMVLEGYETDSNGEVIWIFKNSKGESSGEKGYIKTKSRLFDYGVELNDPYQPRGPFIPPINKQFWPKDFNNQIRCVDKDNDSFCNWGISENKSSTCPSFCNPEKDWNDSNKSIGALGIY